MKTEEEWKKDLTPEQYDVLRNKGTEAPFTGEYVNKTEDGMYSCVACGNVLFNSDTQYDSHCGWPSFYDAVEGSVEFHEDLSHGMNRTEVTCAKCGGHLGHIFDDGPKEHGGKRYCINSIALSMQKSKK